MKGFILILLSFSISFSISCFMGCSSAPTKNLLEERAGYGVNLPSIDSLGTKGGVRYVPTRVSERVIVAWLHAKELPSKDYFWGSWLSIVVAPESWEMKKVPIPETSGPKARPRTQDKPIQKLR